MGGGGSLPSGPDSFLMRKCKITMSKKIDFSTSAEPLSANCASCGFCTKFYRHVLYGKKKIVKRFFSSNYPWEFNKYAVVFCKPLLVEPSVAHTDDCAQERS